MRVLAAMSGGVDSSVVAALLHEQGHDVVGVHMKLHDHPDTPKSGGSKTCCGFDDAQDAREVCSHLGIPFYVMDLRTAFQAAVKDYFTETYRNGGTPNPCIPCNGVLKFGVLAARAKALGCSHVATGHYARILPDGTLGMAVDKSKDQSYFLFPATPDKLAHTLFPLGEMTKDVVREHARRLNLVTAGKPESQEVCFIPDSDHTRFVSSALQMDGSGDFVDLSGKVLGRHDAYWRFTPGQRRGVGISHSNGPLYVLRVEAETRQVVVGSAADLDADEVEAWGAKWQRVPQPDEVLLARIRHRGSLTPCRVHVTGETLTAHFMEPVKAAAPGQAIVFYSGEAVVGGAWMKRPKR